MRTLSHKLPYDHKKMIFSKSKQNLVELMYAPSLLNSTISELHLDRISRAFIFSALERALVTEFGSLEHYTHIPLCE